MIEYYSKYGYLDLIILTDYTEYANNLCEFVLNTIIFDYIVRISIKNNKKFINSNCISLFNINLDTDFISYEKKLRQICVMSKSTLYDIKTTRLNHPSWIVRFSPNFKRILNIFACNLRNLIKKINKIEGYIHKTDINGEIFRYHAISTALTTVKYDLLTLYVIIRSGNLTAMKTSVLYPILNDIQRWLIYSYYQIKIILSFFPGSNINHHLNQRITKNCISSFYLMNKKFKKIIKQSEISLNNENKTEQLNINENLE